MLVRDEGLGGAEDHQRFSACIPQGDDYALQYSDFFLACNIWKLYQSRPKVSFSYNKDTDNHNSNNNNNNITNYLLSSYVLCQALCWVSTVLVYSINGNLITNKNALPCGVPSQGERNNELDKKKTKALGLFNSSIFKKFVQHLFSKGS